MEQRPLRGKHLRSQVEEQHGNPYYPACNATSVYRDEDFVVKEPGPEYLDWAVCQLQDGRMVSANVISSENGTFDVNVVIDSQYE